MRMQAPQKPKSKAGIKRPPARPKSTPLGRDLIAAMQEAVAYARGELDLPVRVVPPPPPLDVAAIRQSTGLTQADFAARFGFSLASVRHWEQSRRQPGRSARLLLTIIARHPSVIEDALRSSLASP